METETPTITTIIPTYRRPHLLRRAIRSALNQTYPHLRVCVYDNASGDETADVVAEITREDSRVYYHCHATNIGMVANFNYGLIDVNTPLFSMLSDDDVLLPSFYEQALKGLKSFPDAIFSACEVIHVNDDGKIIDANLSFWSREGYFSPPEGVFEMLGGRHPAITGTLFRKEVIDRFGIFSDKVFFSDLEWELRIAIRAPFFVSKQPGALFLAHSESFSVQTDLPVVWRDYSRMMSEIKDEYFLSEKDRDLIIETTMHYLYPIVRGMCIRAIARKNFDVARLAVIIMSESYKNILSGVIFSLFILVCEKSGLASILFRYLYNSRKRLVYNSENENLHHKFSAYIHYL